MMLKINVISVLLSITLTSITTILLQDLDLTILTIVILLAFRSVIAEFFLSSLLKVDLRKDILLELLLTVVFICTGWFINSWLSIMLYCIAYISYLTIKKKDIYNTINSLKMLIKA